MSSAWQLFITFSFPLPSDAPAALTVTGRTGWTTAAQMRYIGVVNQDVSVVKQCGDLMLIFFRQRTSYVTSLTPRTSTPLPPRWSPKQQPGAERPQRTGTHPPPRTLPPASPPKVKSKIRIWNKPRAFFCCFFLNQAVLGKISASARANTGWHRLNRNTFQMASRRCRTQQLCLQHF